MSSSLWVLIIMLAVLFVLGVLGQIYRFAQLAAY